MANFQIDPNGTAPRLYALIPYYDGAGLTPRAGVADYAFDDFDQFLAKGDTSPTPCSYSHDRLIAAGVRYFDHFWMFGGSGAGYTVGAVPAGYPGAPFNITCLPWNQVNHIATCSTTSYLQQIVPGLDTAERKGQTYGGAIYCGAVAASSGTSNSQLDAHSSIAEALGYVQIYDAQSALDYTATSNPHYMHVQRQYSRGIPIGGEAWEDRTVTDIQGWLTRQSMCLGLARAGSQADKRAEVATSDQSTWHSIPSLKAAGNRPGVMITQSGPTPTAAELAAASTKWLGAEADVHVDMAGFKEKESINLVNSWSRIASRVAQRDRALQTALINGDQRDVNRVIKHMGAMLDPTPRLTIDVGAEGEWATNRRRITAAVTDTQGKRWDGVWIVLLWIAAAEDGPPSGTGNSLAVQNGTVLSTLTANAAYKYLTDTTGKVVVDLTVAGAATRYVYGAVLGRTWGSGSFAYA